MFPTSLEHPFQPARGRRRGRNEPNNRDYICPCGKSYLSYPALFTHIKIKHNGRAPGQIIKPRSEYANRRGRPKQKQIYDSDSDTEDIAANCIDRLCDYLTDFEKGTEEEGHLKEIYMTSEFYGLYRDFNPQEQEAKFDETEQLYEDTCGNVFCELLAEVNKRLNEPYYFGLLFLFFMMLAEGLEGQHEAEDEQPERGEDSSQRKKQLQVEELSVKRLPDIVNQLMCQWLPEFRARHKLEGVALFGEGNLARLVELFFNWLTMKKYLGCKVRINEKYCFGAQ